MATRKAEPSPSAINLSVEETGTVIGVGRQKVYDFINEGSFLPEITSNDPVVAPLTSFILIGTVDHLGLSAGFVTMGPRQGHTRHNHPGAEEIIVVLSGTGEQMVEDEAGKPIVRNVGPGCTIYVPADRYHYTLNTGDVTVVPNSGW